MKSSLKILAAFAAALPLLAGCSGPLESQPKYRPLGKSSFFPDGRAARPLVEDTVPWGSLHDGDEMTLGSAHGRFAAEFPRPINLQMLERGRERYDIYCAVCHGRTGRADGEIVRRGFPKPPDFHGERLRRAPAGELVAAMAGGYGMMYSYADRVSVEDRWAIAAYIRALQLAGRAPASALSASERGKLEAAQ
jgi:mono/diheme cytochrome c family protein